MSNKTTTESLIIGVLALLLALALFNLCSGCDDTTKDRTDKRRPPTDETTEECTKDDRSDCEEFLRLCVDECQEVCINEKDLEDCSDLCIEDYCGCLDDHDCEVWEDFCED